MKTNFDHAAHVQAHKDRIAKIKQDIKNGEMIEKEKDKRKQRRKDKQNERRS